MQNRIYLIVALILSLTFNTGPTLAEDKALGSKLYEVVLFQDLPALQQLIAKGADVNHMENGRPLLGWASQSGNVDVVNALLKAGANPNIADIGIGHTPLMRAIDTQQTETVRVLLQAKANPNAKGSDGKSALMMAVGNRRPEIVAMVVEAGADVAEVTPDGDSPVLIAAQDGSTESLEIIRILGKAKAKMNASNAAYTPLVYAVQQGNKDLVAALLSAGADPNGRTDSGHHPIIDALGYPEILNLLIEAKVDINAPIRETSTPLAEAIYSSQTESAKILIEAGADTTKGAPTGSTIIEVAEQYGLSEIVSLLKSKGAGGATSAIAVDVDNTAPSVDFNPNSDACTIVDAARKQMNLHGRLQKQVEAGKRSDDIFRTFNTDTTEFGTLLTENPPAACKLLDRLATKYGVSWND